MYIRILGVQKQERKRKKLFCRLKGGFCSNWQAKRKVSGSDIKDLFLVLTSQFLLEPVSKKEGTRRIARTTYMIHNRRAWLSACRIGPDTVGLSLFYFFVW